MHYKDTCSSSSRGQVVTEMREPSRLYIKFKERKPASTLVEDMFSRDSLEGLVDTIQDMVSKPTGRMENNVQEEHGLKLFIDSIILPSIKTLQGHSSETKQDEKSKEMKMLRSHTHIELVNYSQGRDKIVLKTH